MTTLGLVGATLPTVSPAVITPAELPVCLADTLASSHRLWVRGGLFGPDVPPSAKLERRWWARWAPRPPAPAPLLLVRLETEVSGIRLQTDSPIDTQGRVEALFSTHLPP